MSEFTRRLRRLAVLDRGLTRLKEQLPYRLMPHPNPIDEALAAMPRGLSFLQLGSNDGVTGDAIHRFVRWRGWTGAVVEPSPGPFGRLQHNYARNPRVRAIQTAVGAAPAQADFFHVEPQAGDPWWVDQIGSFDMQHVLKHDEHVPNIAQRVAVARVAVRTVDDICDEAGLGRLDLVHLDVEGFDLELLQLLPYSDRQIGAVIFEHSHMSADELDLAHQTLAREGFIHRARSEMDELWVRSS